MKIARVLCLAVATLLFTSVYATAAFTRNEVKDVRDSAEVLQEIMRIPEKGIPPALLRDAKAVVIIPDTIKGAFIVGGRHGTGVALVRQENGKWSDPLFVSISGASFGWQIGGKATDLVLVFKSMKGVEGLLKGKFTLGADASIAAGPVGRSAEAATDVMLKSEILSYSRSRGFFGGVSLEGAALLVSQDANEKYYGKLVSSRDILDGMGGKKRPETRRLQDLLYRYSEMR
ncbi:lipid-binding SYLF domain-containing protein [Geomonas sp. Red32]|uniref:lipid-binding SYLF domain-containing protein n=1 Tax=Geomonas sp. Red32 TaxID=2912856 RepID=UPI00202D0019|nr:lipid-binding SYLF domain-containing protein [Geomonas sp. Red32]MCM0081940.1 lipid-binding SYLF domain-containing protein [Geomonas sp. Red32]